MDGVVIVIMIGIFAYCVENWEQVKKWCEEDDLL